MAELTVWYNTRCPVCDAGITHQKRRLIEAVKSGRIEFRDINLEPAALARYGASLEDIRRRLHATDAAGGCSSAPMSRSQSGARRRARVGWRRLLGNPVLLPVTRFVYDRFADLLYAWNRRKGRW